MRIDVLKTHPENSRIYSPTDLSDLKNSLATFGQLEPIAITKKNLVISGHRRLAAMTELGWTDCDIRIVEVDNEIIALIEHNRHRQKTASDIVNEARYLEKELKDLVGRGWKAAKNRDDKNKSQRLKMVNELGSRLGVGTTRLKQLLSISNYDPKLISKIDKGNLSVSSAYKIVQTKHIKKHKSSSDEFEDSFRKFLKEKSPTLSEVNDVLKTTFPYSLEMSGITEDRRFELIEHLERLKRMDSRTYMLTQKREELENLETTPKEIRVAKSLLPSHKELEEFWKDKDATRKVKTLVADGSYTCKRSRITLSKQLWNLLRISIHSQEHADGPGRKMSFFVGFENAKGFRLLGLVAFRSDSHTLQVRDVHIGWTTDQRAKNREHLVNMSVCVPTQPFGHDRLGGKFISLMAQKMIGKWEHHYKTKIIAIMTTSLHGSYSQYTGMNKWWKNLGTTSGGMILKPLREEWIYWRTWLREQYPNLYDDANSRPSPIQSMLNAVFRLLNIQSKEYTHEHHRGVFIFPLYEHYREFLTDTISEKKLIPIKSDWEDWWLRKSQDRKTKLKSEKRESKEQLFHESIGEHELDLLIKVCGTGRV